MSSTRDALWGGKLVLWQPGPGQGYRFNLDPVLLAGFAPACHHLVDLGSGCGVLAILLLAMGKAETATAVEIQTELAELARRNAADNSLTGRLTICGQDLRLLELPKADAVVFNPPYFKQGQGRPSPQVGRDAGRFERLGTLTDFVAAAGRCLRPGGLASAIVPMQRLTELEELLGQNGLTLTRRRLVVSRSGQKPRHALVTARKCMPDEPAQHAVQAEPELVVHEGQGRRFTAEVRSLLHEA